MARATNTAPSYLFGNNLARLRRIEALEQRALLAADVYVNDNWVESVNHAGGTPGVVEVNDVVDNSADAGQPPQGGIFGIDAFATIQGGIGNVDPLGTVHVLLGAYVENVIVDKPLHLRGDGESIVTVRPAVSGPGVGEIGSLPAGASSIVLVQAGNVEISGITLDGDNPSLASGVVVGGADIDARNGIITNHRLPGSITGLNVHDVTVRNAFMRGIQAGTASGTFTFSDNFVANVQGDFDSIGIANFGGSGTISGNTIDSAESGIVTDGSRGTTITANAVTGARVGIGSYNHGTLGQSNPDVIGGPAALSGNTIDDGVFGSYGIVVVNPNFEVSVQGNSVTDASLGIAVLGGGASVTLRGNTASRTTNEINSIGILVTNEELGSVIGNADATLSGNNVSGFDVGVVVEEFVGGATSVSITSGSIAGGRGGIVLNGDLALTGGTLGSLGFSGQSGNYITLASGALDDLKINAAAVTFDGLTGAAMTAAERAALETRITHEPDDPTLGLVVIAGVNSPPVAADQTLTADEDVKIEGKVTATDADGDKLTFTKVSDPATGTLVLNSDGTFTYTPATNFNGSVDFTFQADDGRGGADTAKVTLTLTPVNDIDAVNDSYAAKEDTRLEIAAPGVLGNDVDPDTNAPDKHPITGVVAFDATSAKGGAVVMNPNGSFTYTPATNFQGNDTFSYTITDSTGASDSATVTVEVIDVGEPPDAKNDTATTNHKTVVINVLANDVDPEGGKLTVTKVTQGSGGTVTIGADGANVTYTPNPGFAGSDLFTYTITDPEGGTDTALVLMTVVDPDPFPGSDGDDVFYVRRDATGNNVQVFANDMAKGTVVFEVPIATAPRLTFDLLGGNDRLIVDWVNGNPIPRHGIAFAGGANGAAGDRLTLRNGGVDVGAYSPSASTTGNGVITVSQRNIDLVGVEPIDVSAFTSFTVITPNASDTLTINRPAADMMELAGASGGVAISPVSISNVSSLIIDAAANDGGAGNDLLAINASGDVPNSVGFMEYRSGTGANLLDVQNGSLRIDSTVAAGGSLDTKIGAGALLITHRFRQNGLTLADGATATVLEDSTSAGASVLTSLSIGAGATLDITNNALVVDYTGASPASTIRDKILSGRGGSGLGKSWNGTGITSSTVVEVNRTDPESRSVGFAENATLPLGAYTLFRGVAVDNTAVLVSYARTGDANLDGLVNDDDVTIVGASYAPGVPNASWAIGDFDYNGFVDDDDVTLLGAFYNPPAGTLTRPPFGTLEGGNPLLKVRMDAELIDLLARSIAIDGDVRSASQASQYRPFGWRPQLTDKLWTHWKLGAS